MKKFLLASFAFFSFASFECVAQNDSLKGRDSKYGISIQMNTIERPFYEDYFIPGEGITEDNSFSFGLSGKYAIQQNLFLRLRFAFNNIDVELTDTSYNVFPEIDYFTQRITHKTQTISPGIFFMSNLKKINFYGGFELPVKLFGNYVTEMRSKQLIHDTLSSSSLSTETSEKWNAYGVGIFLGFEISLRKHISIGGEVSSSWLYTNSKGRHTVETLTLDKNDNVTATFTQTKIQNYKGKGVSKPVASLMVTFLF